jgi:hypothetical protein
MKARRLSEVRQLVGSPEFKLWWESLLGARRARDDARDRHEELLSQAMLMDFRAELAQKNAIDTLYRAGELEDEAARGAVESLELENASFKVVAEFEEQRYRASETWYRACAFERQAEGLKEQLAARRGTLAKAAAAARREGEPELARLEAELKRVERSHAQASQENERDIAVKNRLWEDAEKIWGRMVEIGLLMAERRVQSKKVRAEAEGLFKQAEERKRRAAELRVEAEAAAREREAAEGRLAGTIRAAADRFGCTMGDEFAYFRQREDPKSAWGVALTEDLASYNIEVRPLSLYGMDQRRGAEFLVPAVEGRPSDAEGDRRFDDYFLQGRKGRAPPGEPLRAPDHAAGAGSA